ncbi:SgcJ/EcaC family oxidoreductase [Nonomuraea typhae]|uniref:SgcJ/EcaC family oxidoreductase n=1 Tax=Nonomuraea typhae TaxID=2603600 RepID=UPI0012F89EE0|nr:SgcJ/EcaC family oxidoreductase [Nonomuraea typhae]
MSAEAAIRQLVEDASRHQNDPEPFLALHAGDASIVNFGGRRVLGRDAIGQAMRAALATPLAQVRTTVEVTDIRFVRPDVAVVGVKKFVHDERESDDSFHATEGWLTYVVAEDGEGWRIVSAQTTPVLT